MAREKKKKQLELELELIQCGGHGYGKLSKETLRKPQLKIIVNQSWRTFLPILPEDVRRNLSIKRTQARGAVRS